MKATPKHYIIILGVGLMLTFWWLFPLIAASMTVGWLARGKYEPMIQKFKQAYNEVSP